jgi:glycosyltransferase involved in cell wall biosynthesis
MGLDGGRELEVCLASPLFRPEYSGAAERFRRYAPGLRDRGIRMHVVAAEVGTWLPDRRYESLRHAMNAARDTVPELPVHRVPLPRGAGRSRTRWAYENALLTRCSRGASRPDLIIWLSLSPKSVLTLFRLRSLGIPNLSVQTMVKAPPVSGWKRWPNRIAEVLQHRLIDCLVVSSRYMEQTLRRRGVPTRIESIPHGVDLERFQPSRKPKPSRTPQIFNELGLEPGCEVVLFVGPIEERKGVDLLIQAWDRVAREHPRAYLLLVGPERARPDGHEGSFSGRLRSLLGSVEGAERVRFVGVVDNVEEYMRAADLFVFPSRREGMPNAVCEAFASGLPTVLAPFLGLSDEFGRPGEQYVLAPHDGQQLGEVISVLLADPDRRARIGASARRWVEEHLDIEVSLNRLAAVARDVAGSGV